MFKKVIPGMLLLGLIAVLAVGAINRTASKTAQTPNQNQRDSHPEAAGEIERSGWGQGNQGRDPAQNRSGQGPSASNRETGAAIGGWVTLQGLVVSANEDALTVETLAGAAVVEGHAWSFAQEQGFAVQTHDPVILTGFYDNNAFQVSAIENLRTDRRVMLHDESGRPAWSGRGRRNR